MSAGRLLWRLTLVPCLLAMAWLLVGLPLLLLGRFTPGLMLVLALPAAGLLLAAGLRRMPDGLEAPWWSVVSVLVIAAGFVVHQAIFHSEQIIVRRDPASYLQFAIWIAGHGELPIPRQAEAFGGDGAGLAYHSLAFYDYGGEVVPQFMAGLPMTLAAAIWLGGVSLALFAAPVLGGCGVLAFAGLVARLVGPRWAPLGALALAVTLPQQFVSRSSYSEPLAQVLLLGGLCLMIDALDRAGPGARVRAGLAGLALGLTVLVRIDGVRDVLPVLLYLAVLVLPRERTRTASRRRTLAVPLVAGLAAGVAYGLADGLLLSRPYLDNVADSLRPLSYLTAAFAAVTLGLIVVFRRRGLPSLAATRLPAVAAVLVVLVFLAFAVRPYLQTVRGERNPLTIFFVGQLQRFGGLPYDPTRQYSEISLYWVVWYVGVPVVLLAAMAAALLTRRVLLERATWWTLPLAVIGWTTVTTLWRPAITPDHPWASRRLAALVIPGMILLAVWAAAWLVRRARQGGHGRWAMAALTGFTAVSVVVPGAFTAAPLAADRIEAGELAAIRGMCRQIGQGAAVLIVERVTADRFAQVIRGMCGVPTARPGTWSADVVAAAVDRIRAAGRRPVLVGANPGDLEPYGGPMRQIMRLETRRDEHRLVEPPTRTTSMQVNVWMSEPDLPTPP